MITGTIVMSRGPEGYKFYGPFEDWDSAKIFTATLTDTFCIIETHEPWEDHVNDCNIRGGGDCNCHQLIKDGADY